MKEWQVHRVVDKIRSLSHPAQEYAWILIGGSEYELAYQRQCPEHYKEREDHWLATVRTTIKDTVDGRPARLSLGLAIDMLWPCHWRFVENLQIVLGAIGGNLEPPEPFAACGRNIGLSPIRRRMEIIAATLRAFCGDSGAARQAERQALARLGEPTDTRRWLAASLEKTIRLQLDPPDEVRALSGLPGPAWLLQ